MANPPARVLNMVALRGGEQLWRYRPGTVQTTNEITLDRCPGQSMHVREELDEPRARLEEPGNLFWSGRHGWTPCRKHATRWPSSDRTICLKHFRGYDVAAAHVMTSALTPEAVEHATPKVWKSDQTADLPGMGTTLTRLSLRTELLVIHVATPA